MAGADYRRCDLCGGKAFCDADLFYEDGESEHLNDRPPYKIASKNQYDRVDMLEKYGLRLGYVGDWAVLCNKCSKTHKTVIVPIE